MGMPLLPLVCHCCLGQYIIIWFLVWLSDQLLRLKFGPHIHWKATLLIHLCLSYMLGQVGDDWLLWVGYLLCGTVWTVGLLLSMWLYMQILVYLLLLYLIVHYLLVMLLLVILLLRWQFHTEIGLNVIIYCNLLYSTLLYNALLHLISYVSLLLLLNILLLFVLHLLIGMLI